MRNKGADMMALEYDVSNVSPNPAVINDPNAEKEDLLIEYLSMYQNPKDAALAAGYAEATAGNIYSLKLKKPKFQDKLRAKYTQRALGLIPRIAKIESDIIDRISLNVEEAPKFKDTLKQIKQSAGVIGQDAVPGQNTINIANMQCLVTQIHNDKEGKSG